jgi:hypothetical protein
VEEFLTPIIGCLSFLKCCDEVLEISFLVVVPLRAVKTSSAATAMLFPFFRVPDASAASLLKSCPS